jgi:hypothetical protein
LFHETSEERTNRGDMPHFRENKYVCNLRLSKVRAGEAREALDGFSSFGRSMASFKLSAPWPKKTPQIFALSVSFKPGGKRLCLKMPLTARAVVLLISISAPEALL